MSPVALSGYADVEYAAGTTGTCSGAPAKPVKRSTAATTPADDVEGVRTNTAAISRSEHFLRQAQEWVRKYQQLHNVKTSPLSVEYAAYLLEMWDTQRQVTLKSLADSYTGPAADNALYPAPGAASITSVPTMIPGAAASAPLSSEEEAARRKAEDALMSQIITFDDEEAPPADAGALPAPQSTLPDAISAPVADNASSTCFVEAPLSPVSDLSANDSSDDDSDSSYSAGDKRHINRARSPRNTARRITRRMAVKRKASVSGDSTCTGRQSNTATSNKSDKPSTAALPTPRASPCVSPKQSRPAEPAAKLCPTSALNHSSKPQLQLPPLLLSTLPKSIAAVNSFISANALSAQQQHTGQPPGIASLALKRGIHTLSEDPFLSSTDQWACSDEELSVPGSPASGPHQYTDSLLDGDQLLAEDRDVTPLSLLHCDDDDVDDLTRRPPGHRSISDKESAEAFALPWRQFLFEGGGDTTADELDF